MDSGTHSEMAFTSKPPVLPIVALENSPSFKFGLGQLVLDPYKPVDSSGHQTFANPEFQSTPSIHTLPFGAWYTKYQPETICVDPFGEQTSLCCKPIVKLQHSPPVP